MDITTILLLAISTVYIVGAIAYGLHIRKTEGAYGAIAEALIWPIVIAAKKSSDN